MIQKEESPPNRYFTYYSLLFHTRSNYFQETCTVLQGSPPFLVSLYHLHTTFLHILRSFEKPRCPSLQYQHKDLLKIHMH